MAGFEGKPEIQEGKLDTFPTTAVSEFFTSKFRGIQKSSGTVPSWNTVPKSATQELVHTLLFEDEQRKECAEKAAECSKREKYLDQQWEEIRQLEVELKTAFIDTAEKIKALTKREDSKTDRSSEQSVDERIEILELECHQLEEMKKLFAEETMDTENTIAQLEKDIKGLTPYMVFAEDVAKSAPDLYLDGAVSVLKQFEKLQSAQKEITKCQEHSLAELEKLRCEAQTFTTTALKKLDLLQSKIQEKKTQEEKNVVISDEMMTEVKVNEEKQKLSSGEVQKMEESIKCLYQQLWKRFHGNSSTPPTKDIEGQTKYIEVVLTALDSLAKDLRKAEPNDNESAQAEASQML